MRVIRNHFTFPAIIAIILLTACERQNIVCPPHSEPKPTISMDELLVLVPTPGPSPTPVDVEINGRIRTVDLLVSGPFCNDIWSGTVYVGCDAIVAESKLDDEDNPLFLKGCDLHIEPNTIVYVADHNDQPFYKGCSCHTGKEPLP